MNPKELRIAAQSSPLRINAAGAADARAAGGRSFAPASLLVDARPASTRPLLLAAGLPEEVDAHPAARAARVLDLPRSIILPAMVNAHTHLDLTHIGPRPHTSASGFVAWVEMIRANRAENSEQARLSVLRGIELSRSAGVVAAGDIAGAPRDTPGRASLAPWRAMIQSGFSGVSFLEFFAIGAGRERFRQWLPPLLDDALREWATRGTGAARIGLQPHAPNTVEIAAYAWAAEQAARRGVPLSTHLAESPEEREFVGAARGPMRDMLERFGLWDELAARDIGLGRSPVAHVAQALRPARPMVAHVNDASDADIEGLVKMGATVAYCPRASAYFDAPAHFGPHRYRDMLAAGVPVVLGTDSIVNLPDEAARTPAEGGRGMSILDEMRLLWRRDQTDPHTLLAMGTSHAAAALGLDGAEFTFNTGHRIAGLVRVEVGGTEGPRPMRGDPLTIVLESDEPAELLLN